MVLRMSSQLMWLVAAFLGCVFIFFEMQIMNLEDNKSNLERRVARLEAKDRQVIRDRGQQSLERDDLVVIYNRVPKTASTSFVGVAYDLCKANNFRVLHINITGNMHVLSLPNQLQFVNNVSRWDEIKPAFYHGHMAYLEFARFGASQQPLYINLIRKPLDRLVSYYYFLRFGDDYRPYLVRKKHGDKMTFDECVQLNQNDCHPDNMWLQIPFFCGHAAECWIPGNEWALGEAKRNLLHGYLVVGVTEELGDFVRVLEAALPRMFRGAAHHYDTSNKSHLRKTAQKGEPSDESVKQIRKSLVWQMENEFYEFALDQFQFTKKKVLGLPGDKGQQFMYEKIRPK